MNPASCVRTPHSAAAEIDKNHAHQGAPMNLDGEIVTVRPQVTIDTIQKLPNYLGISNATAGSQGISMNIVIIPPAARAEPHYHDGFETAIYLLKGDVETFYGENLAKSVVNTQGDFIFIPAGVPHQPVNLSSDTEAIALVARNDPKEQESVKVYHPQR
jgi:uncharacterized RmlC-like cupin family protein